LAIVGYGAISVDVVSDVDARLDPSKWPLSGRRHAAAVGVFDGVHRGHRDIVRAAAEAAHQVGSAVAVVTFDPHPARVLRPDLAPATLTGFDHKMELLAELGVDTTLVIRFDQERSEESASDFVATILVGALGITHVVVGDNFHFGRDRQGDSALLTDMGRDHDYTVLARPLSLQAGIDVPSSTDPEDQVLSASEPISSTAIRQAIARGDVDLAHSLLGRPHEVRGTIVPGDRRGRTIGFPTANVAVPVDSAVPADGVYAGWWVTTGPDGRKSTNRDQPSRWPCAINVGKRPTFYEDAEHSVIEAHLIDWQGDLYGATGGVQFVSRLRSEQKFDGLDSLKEQLGRDIDQARNHLAA